MSQTQAQPQAQAPLTQKKIISSDSHVSEPEGTYDDIDPRFRDNRPVFVNHETLGPCFQIPDFKMPVPLSMINAAGRRPEDIQNFDLRLEDLEPGGWDPKERLIAQDRDGIWAEVIYPSVGMVLCLHPDIDYKRACFAAYNRWLAEFCAHEPGRLIGIGQAAIRTIDEGVGELEEIKRQGFRGVMIAGDPHVEDYDHECYAPFWAAAIDLELPVSFHILTSKSDDLANSRKGRGPKINSFMQLVRGNQDIMGMLCFAGVFERHPELKVVCVEADAGWVPHFTYRMDHAYNRHRFWMETGAITRPPSEYFYENIYTTYQDDFSATHNAEDHVLKRVMWANDFPHSDSTWPWSQEILARLVSELSQEQRDWILHDNVAELYQLDA
jgi:predicted TIM-barrel fold metal-dependent hydrolase